MTSDTAAKPRYWLSPAPTHCEVSGQVITEQFVDGAMPGVRHSWACMHPDYFRQAGGTIAPGSAQLYERQADGRWLKVGG